MFGWEPINERRYHPSFPNGGGRRSIHGAYYSGEDNGWVPLSWYPDGVYLAREKPCSLDIRKAISEGKLAVQQKEQKTTPEEPEIQVQS